MSLDPYLAGAMCAHTALQARTDNPTVDVGACADWDPIVELRDAKVREQLCRIVIHALHRDHLNAFEVRSRSPPLVDDLLRFLAPDYSWKVRFL